MGRQENAVEIPLSSTRSLSYVVMVVSFYGIFFRLTYQWYKKRFTSTIKDRYLNRVIAIIFYLPPPEYDFFFSLYLYEFYVRSRDKEGCKY